MESLASGMSLYFALFLFIVSFCIRRVLEIKFPVLSKSTPLTTSQQIWENVFLPMLPALTGMVICFFWASKGLYPDVVDVESRFSRVIYGTVVGFFSSNVYRFALAMLKTVQGKYAVQGGMAAPTIDPPAMEDVTEKKSE